MDAPLITGLFRKLFDCRKPDEGEQEKRVWVSGKFVVLTPQQARRFNELKGDDPQER
jgi:hypothetical protein